MKAHPEPEKEFRLRYKQQKSHAQQRGIGWKFTFNQWQQMWLESGHWEERGRGVDGFVMSRKGDVGAYSANNCFIQLGTQNVRDGNLGKQKPPRSDEHRNNIRKAKLGIPRPKTSCPHCQRVLAIPGLTLHMRSCSKKSDSGKNK